jgi:hypothetical protein
MQGWREIFRLLFSVGCGGRCARAGLATGPLPRRPSGRNTRCRRRRSPERRRILYPSSTRAIVKNRTCAAHRRNIFLQPTRGRERPRQEPEEGNKVGLSGPIRANRDSEIGWLKVPRLPNGLESGNCDALQPLTHRTTPLPFVAVSSRSPISLAIQQLIVHRSRRDWRLIQHYSHEVPSV